MRIQNIKVIRKAINFIIKSWRFDGSLFLKLKYSLYFSENFFFSDIKCTCGLFKTQKGVLILLLIRFLSGLVFKYMFWFYPCLVIQATLYLIKSMVFHIFLFIFYFSRLSLLDLPTARVSDATVYVFQRFFCFFFYFAKLCPQ